MFKPTGIGPHTLLGLAQDVALMAASQRRTRIGHFASYLWQAVARQVNPTPRELKIEINPNLKTSYRKEYRTFVVTVTMAPRGEDFAPQFMFGTGDVKHGSSSGAGAGYVELIDQKRAMKAELEVEKKLLQETKEQIKVMKKYEEVLTKSSPTGRAERPGKTEYEREKAVDEKELIKQTEKVAAQEKLIEKVGEIEKIITHQPTKMEAEAVPVTKPVGTRAAAAGVTEPAGETEVKGRFEERKATAAVDTSTTDMRIAEPVDAAVETFMEGEERKEDIAELREFRKILREVRRQYRVDMAKRPEILSAAEESGGDQVVFEVWTHSFTDTRRINAHMRPIFRP